MFICLLCQPPVVFEQNGSLPPHPFGRLGRHMLVHPVKISHHQSVSPAVRSREPFGKCLHHHLTSTCLACHSARTETEIQLFLTHHHGTLLRWRLLLSFEIFQRLLERERLLRCAMYVDEWQQSQGAKESTIKSCTQQALGVGGRLSSVFVDFNMKTNFSTP